MRLLFLAAAVVLLGVLFLPFLLSMRFSDSDRYNEELAAWHVRWGDAGSPDGRKSLLEELGRIKPPWASVSGVNRHRQYVRAHELVVLADEAADNLVNQVRASLGPGLPDAAFGCETLAEFSQDAGRILQESGLRLEWVAQACAVRAVARLQLAALRADALLDWLKDEIHKLRPNIASE
jgi:hypothetical protein